MHDRYDILIAGAGHRGAEAAIDAFGAAPSANLPPLFARQHCLGAGLSQSEKAADAAMAKPDDGDESGLDYLLS